jgi:hypothetical protein
MIPPQRTIFILLIALTVFARCQVATGKRKVERKRYGAQKDVDISFCEDLGDAHATTGAFYSVLGRGVWDGICGSRGSWRGLRNFVMRIFL